MTLFWVKAEKHVAAHSKITLGTAAICCTQRRHCHVYDAKSNLWPREHNFVLGLESSLYAFRMTTYTKDGFAGKPLATYEHRNTVQIYSYSPAPNRPATHGASFGAVENKQHSHCCWPVLLRHCYSTTAYGWSRHEQEDCHVGGLNQWTWVSLQL